MPGRHRGLVCEWEDRDMEEHNCRLCGGDEGYAGIQLLRQKAARLQRTAQLLAVASLLLLLAALALVITVALGVRSHRSTDSQPMKQPNNSSSGVPHALLTAPYGRKTNGKYLEWESEKGKAYCHGGFNYTNGYLVVPTEGMYRVFLQITFEGKDDVPCDDDQLALTIKVFEKSNQYNANMPLLSSVDTVSCNMGKWSKSLYTNALFKLYANSTLCVQSTYPDLIVTSEYLVFFGAEFLHQ